MDDMFRLRRKGNDTVSEIVGAGSIEMSRFVIFQDTVTLTRRDAEDIVVLDPHVGLAGAYDVG